MKKSDLILITAIIFLSTILYLTYQIIPKKESLHAIISVNAEQYKKVSLLKDESITIELGSLRNVITIESGQAYMEEASCPDHLCVKHFPIKTAGEIIVCLPNRVTVEIGVP